MTLIENLPDAVWTKKGGVCWMSCEGKSVREVAKAMFDLGARLADAPLIQASIDPCYSCTDR